MKRIAIPISEGRLSTRFEGCREYRIFRVKEGKVKSILIHTGESEDDSGLPAWIREHQITDIIAYKISPDAVDLFARHKINVWVGAPDEAPAILMRAYLEGTLTSDEKVMRRDP